MGMLEIDNIITLENNKEYLILETTKYNGKNYYYAVEVAEDETKIKSYKIFETLIRNGEEYIVEIEDMKLQQTLLSVFRNNFSLKLSSMGKKNIATWIGDAVIGGIALVFCFILSFPWKILPLIIFVLMALDLLRVLIVFLINMKRMKKIVENLAEEEEKNW